MDEYRRFITSLMWMVILFFMLLLVAVVSLFTLTGCTNVKYVPVESVRIERDTVVRHDTISRYIRSESTTKEIIKDSTHVVQDESGNIKSKERIRDRYIIIDNRDSIYYYRHRSDSMMSVKTDSVQVPYPVEKKLTRWEQIKMDMGGMAIGAVAIFILSAALVWLIRRKRNL